MKKLSKMIMILFVFMLGFIINPLNVVNAGAVSNTIGKMAASNVGEKYYSGLQATAGQILGMLQIASAITTVIMIAFFGFKLLIDTPPDAKSELKKRFLPIVIGAVMVFGATSIAKFIIGVAA